MNSKYLSCVLIALGSGAAALSHELLWTRRLIDILGASGEATSLTLGCFFCGLSLGAAIVSNQLGRVKNAWASLAALEIAIALLTLPAALLPLWTSWIWPALGPEALVGWTGRFVKLLVSGAVVLPSATLMGMTLPVLILALGRTVSDSPRTNVLVYASNTIGGATGLLATSVWLLQPLGVFGCMMVAAGTNIMVGLAAWGMSRITKDDSLFKVKKKRRRKGKQSDAVDAQVFSKQWLLGMACGAGLAVLALEVVVIRLLSLIVPSSFQATSAVLLTVILLIGIAALLVPFLLRLVPFPRSIMVLIVAGAAAACAFAPFLLYEKTKELIDVPHLVAIDGRSLDSPWDFQVEVFSLAIVTVGPALLLAASVFPALLANLNNDQAESVGRDWASLLAINGVGGLVGTIGAEYLLIPTFGIYGGLIVVGIVLGLISFAAAITAFTNSLWRLVHVAAGVVALACCFIYFGKTSDLSYISPHTTRKFVTVDTRFGKDGVCCVVEMKSGKGIMLNNQYVLGSTNASAAQRRQVLIPLLILEAMRTPEQEPKAPLEVCCLGLATGISAGAALDFDDSCRVTAVELSPMVIDVAKDHFSQENRGVVVDSRSSVIEEDARTYMAAVRERFDVVAGDLYRPYGSGEGRLFSLEHFRNVTQALRPGGVYCQWIPAYQVTEEHFSIIAATFLEANPDAILLCPEAESNYPILGLLTTKGEVDWEKLQACCRSLTEDGKVKDPVLQANDFAESVYVAKLSQEQFADVPINTLDNVIIEIEAGQHRTIHTKASQDNQSEYSYLSGEKWKAFLHKIRNR